MEVVAEGVETPAPRGVPAQARLPLRAGQAVRRALHRTGSARAALRARRTELHPTPVSSPRRMRLRAGSPDRKRRNWRRWVLLAALAAWLRNRILEYPQAAVRRHAHRRGLDRRAGRRSRVHRRHHRGRCLWPPDAEPGDLRRGRSTSCAPRANFSCSISSCSTISAARRPQRANRCARCRASCAMR